jgi:hypothetical protein
MAEATLYKDANANAVDITAPAALSAGQVLQLADGRAAFVAGLAGAAADDPATLITAGQVTVAKTASIVILDGGEVMWDHSANSATIPVYGTSKDFYLGRAVGDAASADTTMVVELNAPKNSAYITLRDDSFASVHVRTAGLTQQGMSGGSYNCIFSLTAEAQKFDLLSDKSFAIDANWIFEAVVNVITNADADVGDLNVGVANATHASDCDSITESCFAHFDMGADLNLDAESDDGTTEVAATDTTVDWAVGTPVHIAIDGRTQTDIQIYVNGVNVLPATTFTLGAGTGPLKALFHLEKSSNDSPGAVRLSKMEVRLTTDVEA